MSCAGVRRGLYGGVGPTVLKGAVNNCIRFSTFNELKHLYLDSMGRKGEGPQEEEKQGRPHPVL